jgi:hypothetical protein
MSNRFTDVVTHILAESFTPNACKVSSLGVSMAFIRIEKHYFPNEIL